MSKSKSKPQTDTTPETEDGGWKHKVHGSVPALGSASFVFETATTPEGDELFRVVKHVETKKYTGPTRKSIALPMDRVSVRTVKGVRQVTIKLDS